MDRGEYEKLARKILSSPKFWFNEDSIKELTGLTYWTEVRKVTDILSDNNFRAKMRRYHEGFRHPTEANKIALKNIEAIDEIIGLGGGPTSRAVQGVKLPWEMTMEEFYKPVELPDDWRQKGYEVRYKGSEAIGITTPTGEDLVPLDYWGIQWVRSKYPPNLHEAIVRQAIEKGIRIPPEVLAGYPHLEAKYYGAPKEQKPGELPKFRGYTVDYRLREFRKAILGKTLEFIPFDSAKGKQLLQRMQTELESVPQTHLFHPYSTPARKMKDELEVLHRDKPDEFYRLLKQVKDAIKERERGKIKKYPNISLTELREIKNYAEALYR